MNLYIKKEDILSGPQNIGIQKASINLEKYDMYNISFKLKNGKIQIVRVFTKKNAFLDFKSNKWKNIVHYSDFDSKDRIIYNFFIDRLIGPDGLMVQQKRSDFIFLDGYLSYNGKIRFDKNLQDNQRSSIDDFEKDRIDLMAIVNQNKNNSRFQSSNSKSEQKHDSQKNPITKAPQNSVTKTDEFRKEEIIPLKNHSAEQSKKNGKTYVLSDIHGKGKAYESAMSEITPNDTVIILGDVIDRGKDGIKILQDLIRRKKDREHNPKIIFMMGNHEMQFLIAVNAIEKYRLTRNDLYNLNGYWFYQFKLLNGKGIISDDNRKLYTEKRKEYYNKYHVLLARGLDERDAQWIYLWLVENGGKVTLEDYGLDSKECIKTVEEQKELREFLENAYIILPRTIKNKDYLFVHSAPPKDIGMINALKSIKEGLRYRDLQYDQYQYMLCARDKEDDEIKTYLSAKACGFYKTICGHTPSDFGTITRDEARGFINIDAGCANSKKLALYCVDDDTVKYFEAKEIETPENNELQK